MRYVRRCKSKIKGVKLTCSLTDTRFLLIHDLDEFPWIMESRQRRVVYQGQRIVKTRDQGYVLKFEWVT